MLLNQRSLDALRAQGNSVVVVEHDPNTIARASHIIDIGPLAGQRGGEVVYQGDYAGLIEAEQSITGQFLSGTEPMPSRVRAAVDPGGPHLQLTGVATNNLKKISVQIPLGVIVGVAGVSGSGKSSLVADTLIPLLRAYFARLRQSKQAEEQLPLEYFPVDPLVESFAGAESLQGYAEVSQAPIGRNRTSNVVSYIGIWDALRSLFARQPQAREKGLEAGHFSFNSAGACTGCNGSSVEAVYLGNMRVEYTCRECGGRRYNPETLEVSYKGLNIADVLDLSVAEAVVLFAEEAPIHHMLDILAQTGMDYISLGQTAPTLSGGESQRVKLGKELGRRRRGSILYVIDEPTTGLSLYDVAKLLPILAELTTRGHSVVLTEHDPDVLSYCDWIIELGPGGGDKGGEIITQGSPDTLAADPRSQIGQYLHC
jgi:excinuclease ABC subunit A